MFAGRCRAHVAGWVGIADYRQTAVAIVNHGGRTVRVVQMTPLVWPEITLSAPGVEGPKFVS